MPKCDEDYPGKLDLSSNQMFKKYYSDLEDYSISITSIKLEDFEKKFKDKPFTLCGKRSHRFFFENICT